MQNEFTQRPHRRGTGTAAYLSHLLVGLASGTVLYGIIVILLECLIPGNHYHNTNPAVTRKEQLEMVALATPLVTGSLGIYRAWVRPIASLGHWWDIIGLTFFLGMAAFIDLFILYAAAMAGYC